MRIEKMQKKKKKKNSEAKLEIQIVVRIKLHSFYDITIFIIQKGFEFVDI